MNRNKMFRGQAEIKKEFVALFDSIARTTSGWQAWSDFVECAAISISCGMDRVQAAKRLERHGVIMSGYSEEQKKSVGRMFALVVEALNGDPDQDFLGTLFMQLGLGNHWKGQFFTPYSICRMMAATQLSDAKNRIEVEHWISINDPACGAGALMIAARNELMRQGIDWPEKAVFIAQDIDHVAGMMCYVQLSLLGCAGYVVIGNTITDPLRSRGGSVLLPRFSETQSAWFMPAYFSEPWYLRILGAQMALAFDGISDEIPKRQSVMISGTKDK